MYYQIGDIQFDNLLGFQSFTQARSERIAELSRIESKADLQHVGSELENINIKLTLRRAFADPQPIIDQLSIHQANGDILPIIDGAGKFYGRYVLTGMNETAITVDKDGSKIDVDVTLQFKEYFNPDLETSEAIAARNSATAISENNPVAVNRQTVSNTPLIESIDQVAVGRSNTIGSLPLVDRAAANPSQSEISLAAVKVKMNIAAGSFSDALSTIRTDITAFENVSPNIESIIEDIQISAAGLSTSAGNQDLTGALAFTEILTEQLIQLDIDMIPLNSVAINRKRL